VKAGMRCGTAKQGCGSNCAPAAVGSCQTKAGCRTQCASARGCAPRMTRCASGGQACCSMQGNVGGAGRQGRAPGKAMARCGQSCGCGNACGQSCNTGSCACGGKNCGQASASCSSGQCQGNCNAKQAGCGPQAKRSCAPQRQARAGCCH
jgi:hypothetical protein